MTEKSLAELFKLTEGAISFSTERRTGWVSLSCGTVHCRYDLMSFIFLNEHSYNASETGNVNRIYKAVAKSYVLPIPMMKCT